MCVARQSNKVKIASEYFKFYIDAYIYIMHFSRLTVCDVDKKIFDL